MIKATSESGQITLNANLEPRTSKGPWDNDGRRQIYEKAFSIKIKFYISNLLVIIVRLNFFSVFEHNP